MYTFFIGGQAGFLTDSSGMLISNTECPILNDEVRNFEIQYSKFFIRY